ncbi:MAG: hypothetical protein LBT16_05980 [Treponema sp.]|jgi:hypothetical protein|nr:hypothetical protein [Treponema sp.]
MKDFIKKIRGCIPVKSLPAPVKQWGCFAAWIGGLLLAGILLWALTASFRSHLMLNGVNKSLSRAGPAYQLEAPIASLGNPGRALQLGAWFTLKDSPSWAVVFPIISGTSLLAMLAVVSPGGELEAIIPLSNGGKQTLEDLPAGTVLIYKRRVEESRALFNRRGSE